MSDLIEKAARAIEQQAICDELSGDYDNPDVKPYYAEAQAAFRVFVEEQLHWIEEHRVKGNPEYRGYPLKDVVRAFAQAHAIPTEKEGK